VKPALSSTLAPLKSVLVQLNVCGRFLLRPPDCISPLWSCTKWWRVISGIETYTSFHDLTILQLTWRSVTSTTGGPLFYHITRLAPATDYALADHLHFHALSIPRTATPLTGGARAPFYLVGDVIAFSMRIYLVLSARSQYLPVGSQELIL